MRILVTGAGGYLGCRLVTDLADAGHSVLGVDRFFFGTDGLPESERITWCEADARDVDALPLDGVDVVISLAALSSEAAAARFPDAAFAINVRARERLALRSRAAGVRWFLVPSSSNVYGPSAAPLTESAPVRPASRYAWTCCEAERVLLSLSGGAFAVVVLRQATLYGWSPKMRFDLVVNNLVRCAYRRETMPIAGDGSQRRPFLHVDDAVEAYRAVLRAPRSLVAGQIINVGNPSDNRTVGSIADLVDAELGPLSRQRYGDLDALSHELSYERASAVVAWRARRTMSSAVRQIAAHLCDDHAASADPRTDRGAWLASIGGVG